jgi:hypothetical protein
MVQLLSEAKGCRCPRFMGLEGADSTGRNVLTAGPLRGSENRQYLEFEVKT